MCVNGNHLERAKKLVFLLQNHVRMSDARLIRKNGDEKRSGIHRGEWKLFSFQKVAANLYFQFVSLLKQVAI